MSTTGAASGQNVPLGRKNVTHNVSLCLGCKGEMRNISLMFLCNRIITNVRSEKKLLSDLIFHSLSC